ncbi:MAG: hypothetical protein CBE14_000565 [Rickettsiales bacterium TMED254]|nr:MAG: hypothetical protein CBE14_000565 [Rickettsiales bacterium TMED254]
MNYKSDLNLHQRLLDLLYTNEEEHVGSCFSCIDYLDEIWSNKNKDDVFILSNGHAAYALYVLLEKYEGINAQKLVDKHLGHPNLDYENKIYCTTGSLGQGITVGVGAAIASPNKNVYVSISDGECAEGSVWESLRYAQEYNLKNMHVHVNLNGYACYDPIDADYLERRLNAFMPRINIHKTSSSRFSFLRGIEAHYIKMDKTMYDGACKELNDER